MGSKWIAGLLLKIDQWKLNELHRIWHEMVNARGIDLQLFCRKENREHCTGNGLHRIWPEFVHIESDNRERKIVGHETDYSESGCKWITWASNMQLFAGILTRDGL